MKQSIRVLFVGIMVLLVLMQFGCSIENGGNTSGLYWKEEPSGYVQTNDILKLRQKTQLLILVPAYVPDGLSDPYFELRTDYSFTGDTHISVHYYDLENYCYIRINESYHPLLDFMSPSSLYPYTYIDVVGHQVLEEYWTQARSSSDKTDMHIHTYRWKFENVYIDVEIGGYEQEEARKIMRSMIDD